MDKEKSSRVAVSLERLDTLMQNAVVAKRSEARPHDFGAVAGRVAEAIVE
jgi:hypothetical protein